PFENEQDGAGRITVRERDAHAWAELYFKDVGWVAFDATEGAAEAEGAGRGANTNGWLWLRSTWFLASVSAVALLALAGLILWVRAYARRPKHPHRTRLHKLFRRFSRAMEIASGWVRAPYQSPEEYLEAVRANLNG